MKVQTRLSLFCSIAFGVVFASISCLVYVLYSRGAESRVYKDLENSAHVVSLFHFEEDELNHEDFLKAEKQFSQMMHGIAYQAYDSSDSLVFGNKNHLVDRVILKRIRKTQTYDFATERSFCHGRYYQDNQGDFVIVTKERKNILNRELVSLLTILVCALLVGLIAVILLSRWLARIAYLPVSSIIHQVETLSLDEEGVQIISPNTKDELQDLTDTFNELLSRISESFMIQKNFVNYVSHEFRTPLAAMMGNLEVFSLKRRMPEEYEKLSLELIDEIVRLKEILNTLLVVSDLRKDSDTPNHVRMDELIWHIIKKVSALYRNPKIHPEVEIQPEDESLLTVNRSKTQLYMSLFNIIENAVKYSMQQVVQIRIYQENQILHVSVQDHGIGIPPDELKDISKPFFRGNNTNDIRGNGIGLSIALRILEKAGVIYEIFSEQGKGTLVVLSFPDKPQ
jgi:two-component system, OmpR family, sensor histidine kinase ArlS